MSLSLRSSAKFANFMETVRKSYEQVVSRAGIKPEAGIQAALLLLLALIYILGVWGLVVDHREARRLARRDLELQTESEARTIEAALASSRSDFLYLSRSVPLSSLGQVWSDPLARRWSRLDVEAAALLFMAGHPEVERIQIWDVARQPYLVAARRRGAPGLLPPSSAVVRPESPTPLLRGTWPLGAEASSAAVMEAFVDADSLLERIAPGHPGRQLVRRLSGQETESIEEGGLVAVEVDVQGWQPGSGWELRRRTGDAPIFGATLLLAERHRATTLLGLGLMTLALPLGWLTLRQMRRNAALEAERDQQARIRQLERQVWHQERLSSLGRLAAGMAHEINNPLEGIANYFGILSRELRQRNDEELIEITSRLREGLDRIGEIVGQVLTYADPAGTPMEKLDLNAPLKRSFDFVRSNPSFRHLKMSLSKPDRAVTISGNPVTLGQLFLNLMLNACEVQEMEGEVTVTCCTEGDSAVVTVEDRGPGISEEHADQIFEPFFSSRGSTGLGLSVCLGIVTLHQGRMESRPRDGGGTAMTVHLPLEATAADDSASGLEPQ